MKCFKCGVTSNEAVLFDVVSRTGIAKICNDCYKKENFPIVKQGGITKPERMLSVYERLSGVQSRKGIGKKFLEQDKSLREVVDDNFRKNLGNLRPRDDLIDNFHWVIMRVRRARHFSQKQVAEAIAEPEMAIRMAEEGLLGENSDNLIKKLEDCLDVQLRKGEEFSRKKKKEETDPNSNLADELTIADLKEMQEEKEKVDKVPFWKSWIKRKESEGLEEEVESVEEADVEPYDESGEKPLTDEEVEDVLFGRK